jgi:hypothetical protein
MALERLQTRAPPVAESWPNTDCSWLFVLEQLSDQTACRTKQEWNIGHADYNHVLSLPHQPQLCGYPAGLTTALWYPCSANHNFAVPLLH